MTLTEYLVLASLLIAITGLLIGIFRRHTDKENNRQKDIDDKINALKLDVAALKTRDESRAPYFDELQRALANAAHKPAPEHAEKDKLLEELVAMTLTDERRERLMEILQLEIDDPQVPIALAMHIISREEKVRIQAEVDDARLLLATMPKVVAAQKAAAFKANIEVKADLAKEALQREETKTAEPPQVTSVVTTKA